MVDNMKKKVAYTEGLHYLLNEAARISELAAREYYKHYVKGILELEEFKILSHILANPELSQSDIAKLVYKGKAHVGKILNEMERKDLITRNVCADGHMMVKRTALTEKGKKLYKESDEAFRKLAESTLDAFTDSEKDEFIYLLNKLKEQMLTKAKIVF